jgi:hypothetical protein
VAKPPQLGQGPRRPGKKTRNHDGQDHKLIRSGPRINPIEQQVHTSHDPIPRPHPVPRFACPRHRVDSPKLGSRRAAALLGGSFVGRRLAVWLAPVTASAEPTEQHRLACGAITKKFVRSLLKMWQGPSGRHSAQCSHPWARQSRQGRRCHAAPLAFSPNAAMGERATARLGQLQAGPVHLGGTALALCAAPKVRPASSCASTETARG